MISINSKQLEDLPELAKQALKQAEGMTANEIYMWDDTYLIKDAGRDVFETVRSITNTMRAEKQAAEEEAEKMASMNPVRRAFYKSVEKPVGQFIEKHFKKPETQKPFSADGHASVTWDFDD